MKILNNINKFGSLSVVEMIQLEKKLKITLPEDYKNFLSQTNGGIPKSDYLVVAVPNLEESLLVNSFLGISANENFDLIGWNEEYREELPDSTFIFGIEYGGGMFIQITKGNDKGVYYWDSNFSLSSTSEDENVYFIASSFSDFLNLIHLEK